jgi:hypothetical protein
MELLPVLLGSLRADEVDLSLLGRDAVPRGEYLHIALRQLRERTWSPSAVVGVLSAVRELDVEPDALSLLVEKASRCISELALDQYPPVVYV